jgi:hypothetical protein
MTAIPIKHTTVATSFFPIQIATSSATPTTSVNATTAIPDATKMTGATKMTDAATVTDAHVPDTPQQRDIAVAVPVISLIVVLVVIIVTLLCVLKFRTSRKGSNVYQVNERNGGGFSNTIYSIGMMS